MDWLDTLEPIVRHKDRRSPLYMRLTERVRELRTLLQGQRKTTTAVETERNLNFSMGVSPER